MTMQPFTKIIGKLLLAITVNAFVWHFIKMQGCNEQYIATNFYYNYRKIEEKK